MDKTRLGRRLVRKFAEAVRQRRFSWRLLGIAVLLCSSFAVEPRAQTAEPTIPTWSVNEQDLDEPNSRTFPAGGENRIACGEGRRAPGFFSQSATTGFHYSSQYARTLMIVARNAEADLTIAVRTPSGTWHCDDDTENFNPAIGILRPENGYYEVWVGTFLPSTATVSADIQLSTFPTEENRRTIRQGFRAGFPPTSVGEVDLNGAILLAAALPGTDCTGYVSASPTLRLEYNRAGRNRPLLIQLRGATTSTGTALAVRAPNGRWYCDDDGQISESTVSFGSPQSGRYDVHAGGHFGGRGDLEILEVDEPDPNATPSVASVALNLDEAVAREIFALQAGGPIDASIGIRDAQQSCVGYVSRQPHLAFNVPEGAKFELSVAAAADTTLVVNDPSGRWICNDDSGHAFNPVLRIEARQAGKYSVFVGNYEPVRRRDDAMEHRLLPANLRIALIN